MSSAYAADLRPCYRCKDCGENIPSELWAKHRNEPHGDALRAGQVASILGVSRYTVLYRIRTGRLRALPRTGGKGSPVFIAATELKRYINHLARKTDVAVRWATTGVLDG